MVSNFMVNKSILSQVIYVGGCLPDDAAFRCDMLFDCDPEGRLGLHSDFDSEFFSD